MIGSVVTRRRQYDGGDETMFFFVLIFVLHPLWVFQRGQAPIDTGTRHRRQGMSPVIQRGGFVPLNRVRQGVNVVML